jgi:hypothetical protein
VSEAVKPEHSVNGKHQKPEFSILATKEHVTDYSNCCDCNPRSINICSRNPGRHVRIIAQELRIMGKVKQAGR